MFASLLAGWLAPVNHRAKPTAEVVYTSLVLQSPYSEPPPYLTHQAVSPALNQPRAGTRQPGTAPVPPMPGIIQMSQS